MPHTSIRYFEFRSCMMLNDIGLKRLVDIIHVGKLEGMKRPEVVKKIKRVFNLSDKEYKFFSNVNNCSNKR